MFDYPYFIDIRKSGLNQDNVITNSITQSTVAWASPIEIKKNNNNKIIELLRSSDKSWLSASNDVMPSINEDGVSTYTPQEEQIIIFIGSY